MLYPVLPRFCTKSDVANTAWHKPMKPSQQSFSRACRSVSRSGGSPFSQPNMRSMMLRCRYWGDQTAWVNQVEACASSFVTGSLAASDNDRSNGARPRRHSPCRQAAIDSVYGGGRAGFGNVSVIQQRLGSRRYHWPARQKVESAKARHWRRTACEFWSSGRPGCVQSAWSCGSSGPLFFRRLMRIGLHAQRWNRSMPPLLQPEPEPIDPDKQRWIDELPLTEDQRRDNALVRETHEASLTNYRGSLAEQGLSAPRRSDAPASGRTVSELRRRQLRRDELL